LPGDPAWGTGNGVSPSFPFSQMLGDDALASRETRRMHRSKNSQKAIILLICMCLLLFLSACQSITWPFVQNTKHPPPSPTSEAQQNPTAISFPLPPQTVTPTVKPTPTHGTPTAGGTPLPASTGRPVLAFYYMWYKPSTWWS